MTEIRQGGKVYRPAPKVSLAERERLEKLQFATDANGNRRMSADPEYRKMVDGEFSKLYPGDNDVLVDFNE